MATKSSVFLQVYGILFCTLCIVSLCSCETIKKVVTAGENVSLDCYYPKNPQTQVIWAFREGKNTPAENIVCNNCETGQHKYYNDFDNNKYPTRFISDADSQNSKYTLSVMNATEEDSGRYECTYSSALTIYYISVIGCACNVKSDDLQHKYSVSCKLEGYKSTGGMGITINVSTSQGNKEKVGNLQSNDLTFTISTNELSGLRSITFNPYTNFYSQVSCSLQQLSTTTNSPSTSTLTLLGNIIQNSKTLATTPIVSVSTRLIDISRTHNNQTVFGPTITLDKNKGIPSLTITIVIGPILFLLAAVIIIFLYPRYRGRRSPRDRPECGEDEKKDEAVIEGVYYSMVGDRTNLGGHVYSTSIERTTTEHEEGIGPLVHHEGDASEDGMVDNILYESSDLPLNDAGDRLVEEPGKMPLYAMPDKASLMNDRYPSRCSTKEESKDGNEPRKNDGGGISSTQEHFDPDVLYAMRDKDPRKSSRLLERHEVDVDCSPSPDISALYAQVDKSGTM